MYKYYFLHLPTFADLVMRLSICKTWGIRTDKNTYFTLQNKMHCDEYC